MANCFNCNNKLNFLNTPLWGFGKSKDSFTLCTSCNNKLTFGDSDTSKNIKNLTKDEIIAAINNIPARKMAVQQQKEEEKLQREARAEQEKQIEEKDKKDKEQKVLELQKIIQHLNPPHRHIVL